MEPPGWAMQVTSVYWLGEGSGGLYWTQTYATYLSSPASLHLGAHLCCVPLVKGLQPMLAFILYSLLYLLDSNAGTERIHGKTACSLLQDTSDHPLTLTQLVARRKIFRRRLKIFGQFNAEPSLHSSCHLVVQCWLELQTKVSEYFIIIEMAPKHSK